MKGLLLGRQTPVVDEYSPDLLFPIPRATAREQLGLGGTPPFYGADLWHAYEISWLDSRGKPEARVGRFSVPADSPNMVESKSFKLYLNSINSCRFAGEDEAHATMVDDVSAVVGAPVSLELFQVGDLALAGTAPPGDCLDGLSLDVDDAAPDAALLEADGDREGDQVHSHLLRSLCPVTGQPDWATVWLRYRGPGIDRTSLLRYIIAFRRHQEFHEQCVERMFADIYRRFQPDTLEVQAFYTRRGGLDINPFRSTAAEGRPMPRLNRQ